MIPYNSSEIPFVCKSNEYNTFLEILIYLGTLLYQGIGLILHFSIIKVIFFTERKYYKESSFFQIFVTDSIESSILILTSLFFNRLFIYVPPLCPLIGPYFWNPSVLMKFMYVLTNHTRFAKSITQIFMVFNRMTCVLIPTSYDQIWKKLTPFVWVLLVILPFGGTWNCLIFRIYMTSFRGGFTMDYIRAVEWAALSKFQSFFILTALGFTVVCTTVTLYKLVMLQGRIKSVEKSLCISSLSISCTFLLVAATQLAFAYCSACQGQLIYILQLLAFDIFTVGSGLIVIIGDKKLRMNILPWTLRNQKIGTASPSKVRNRSVSLY